MTLEFAPRPAGSPLPGRPEPYFLSEGEGERSILIDTLFTVLLSADETGGQFGVFTADAPAGNVIPPHAHDTHHEVFYVVRGALTVFLDDEDGRSHARELGPGDFGYVPAGITHAYRIGADDTRVLGVATGAFERFFSVLGEPTEERRYPATPLPMPPMERFMAVGREFDTRFLPPDARHNS